MNEDDMKKIMTEVLMGMVDQETTVPLQQHGPQNDPPDWTPNEADYANYWRQVYMQVLTILLQRGPDRSHDLLRMGNKASRKKQIKDLVRAASEIAEATVEAHRAYIHKVKGMEDLADADLGDDT